MSRNVYYLRNCIKNIDSHPIPKDFTADDIIRGECEIPEILIHFIQNLIEVQNVSEEDNNQLVIKISSICIDIIYTVTRGRDKPAQSLTVRLAIKSLTNSR